jgi:transposase
MPRRPRRVRYTPEFKAEAVRLIDESDASLSEIARNLGVTPKTLRGWREAARPAAREPLTDDERTELHRLRRDIQQVRMERDILKKATAFFARESK